MSSIAHALFSALSMAFAMGWEILWPLILGSAPAPGASPHWYSARSRTDAAHNQHSETRRPSDRDRIVTTGRSRSSPPVQKCCAEMMSVSVAGIQKNRCRTTVAEPMVETLSETALYRDQVGLFKAQPGRTEADLALSGQAGPSASRQFFARE